MRRMHRILAIAIAYEAKRAAFAVSAVAIGGLLYLLPALFVRDWLYRLWTPYAVGGLVLIVGGLLACWTFSRHRRMWRAVWQGGLALGLLYGAFLVVTAGMVAANAHAVQLPFNMGAVYRYDPRGGVPDGSIVLRRPEALVLEYLEREVAFPKSTARIEAVDYGGLSFGRGVSIHPVRTWEVGQVVIRREPQEVWWDDDPTFVATIQLHVRYADDEDRGFIVELESSASDRDPLGLLAQGYLTPRFGSWRPILVRSL